MDWLLNILQVVNLKLKEAILLPNGSGSSPDGFGQNTRTVRVFPYGLSCKGLNLGNQE